jgi:PBP1b-binding outer membrane lipoprotein LpoB
MKKVILSVISIMTVAFVFSGCSAKDRKASEPYYDRANQAAEKAHDRLNKD